MTNMDKLYEAVEARGPVCVGLDTDFSYLPADFVDSTLTRGENIVRFNQKLIDATKAVAGVKPDVFFGFRDAPYCMEEYREIANLVKVSTDTGAVGFHGFVTQLYDPADYDVVLVCGPTVMMRNAARLCAEKGTPCFVSMEKKMACGIGACLGCTCETKSGEGKSVCKNGPVFDATEVFF